MQLWFSLLNVTCAEVIAGDRKEASVSRRGTKMSHFWLEYKILFSTGRTRVLPRITCSAVAPLPWPHVLSPGFTLGLQVRNVMLVVKAACMDYLQAWEV